MTPRQKRNREELVKALRSNRYRQVQGMFMDGAGGFCVMGLAAHLTGAKPGDHVPRRVVEDYGFSEPFCRSMVRYNDMGMSFLRLATEIEMETRWEERTRPILNY